MSKQWNRCGSFCFEATDRSMERLKYARHCLIGGGAMRQYAHEATKRLIFLQPPIERTSKCRSRKRYDDGWEPEQVLALAILALNSRRGTYNFHPDRSAVGALPT